MLIIIYYMHVYVSKVGCIDIYMLNPLKQFFTDGLSIFKSKKMNTCNTGCLVRQAIFRMLSLQMYLLWK